MAQSSIKTSANDSTDHLPPVEYLDYLASRSAWLSIEYGRYSRYDGSSEIHPGSYARAMVEFPISRKVRLMALVDRLSAAGSGNSIGGGIGVTVPVVSIGRFRSRLGAAVFAESGNIGLLVPIFLNYEIIPRSLRIQGSVSLRHSTSLSMESTSSRSFATGSIGIGVALPNVK